MKNIKYEAFPKNHFRHVLDEREAYDSLVVLMHGIGADAFDLIPLAKYWSSALKKTKFYSLYAPYPYGLGPTGRQWFHLEDRNQTRILFEIEAVKPLILRFFLM